MIILSDCKPFAVGMTRLVFVHPHNSAMCIKVASLQTPERDKPVKRLTANRKELRDIRYLESLRNSAVWNHIPRFYETVQTDLGDGVVRELMRDFDGNISRTLALRLSAMDGGDCDSICYELVAEFCEFLLENKIIVNDMNFGNFLSVRIDGRKERLYLVEGYGTKAFIPLQNWLPYLRNRKIRRMITHLERGISQFVDSQK